MTGVPAEKHSIYYQRDGGDGKTKKEEEEGEANRKRDKQDSMKQSFTAEFLPGDIKQRKIM